MKIMIDPGHGGKDPGTVGNGLKEKGLVLTISRHMRSMLVNEYENLQVKMTRDKDVFVGLSERSQMANEWKADYFISIHINAGGGTGFESYIHTSRASRTVELQSAIHPVILDEIKVNDRGKKSANFAVLRQTNMPALLTENLFIDRNQDVQKLKDPGFLEQIARGHVLALEKAFDLQKKSSPQSEELYRVIINGKQVGAFAEHQNIIRQVQNSLGKANEIKVEKV